MSVNRISHEICDLTIKAAEHRDGKTGRWYLSLRLEDGSGLRNVFHHVLMDASTPIAMDTLMAALSDDLPLYSIIRRPDILVGQVVHAMICEETYRDANGWRIHHLYPMPRNFFRKEIPGDVS